MHKQSLQQTTTTFHHESSPDASPVKAYLILPFYCFLCFLRHCLLHASSSSRRGSSRIRNRNWYRYVAFLCLQRKPLTPFSTDLGTTCVHLFDHISVYPLLTFMRCHLVIHVLGQYSTPSYSIFHISHLVTSVQRGGVVEIIANDQGHRITPSWVSFTDDERLYDTHIQFLPNSDSCYFSVGDSAKNAFHSNPENTVFDAKRLIGRKMDDQDIARDMKHWPFKVAEKNGKPAITVKHKGGDRDFVSCSLRPNDNIPHFCPFIRLLRKLVLWFLLR